MKNFLTVKIPRGLPRGGFNQGALPLRAPSFIQRTSRQQADPSWHTEDDLSSGKVSDQAAAGRRWRACRFAWSYITGRGYRGA